MSNSDHSNSYDSKNDEQPHADISFNSISNITDKTYSEESFLENFVVKTTVEPFSDDGAKEDSQMVKENIQAAQEFDKDMMGTENETKGVKRKKKSNRKPLKPKNDPNKPKKKRISFKVNDNFLCRKQKRDFHDDRGGAGGSGGGGAMILS
jgi:hypothetical protein